MFAPRRILAAVDFSDSSRIALNAAGRLAGQFEADLVVLHAVDPLLAEAARTANVDLVADTAAELTRFVATAVTRPLAQHLVIVGAAVDVICAIAERENADVIVMGARGMSGVAHALFGSTTERVLRNSSVSVFVVPDAWTAPDPASHDCAGIGPVVVGVDLRCGSAAAAAAAGALARALHTRLDVIHVVPPITTMQRWRGHAEQAAIAATHRAHDDLELLTRRVRETTRVTTRVETGDVARVLADAVRPHGDCRPILVLGRNPERTHGMSPGAVAYRVLMTAAAPILVCLPAD